jgi:hypothetical protein
MEFSSEKLSSVIFALLVLLGKVERRTGERKKKSLSQPGAWRGEFKRCVNRTVSIKNFFLPPLSFSLADVTVKSIELDDGCAELKRCEY